MQKHYHYHNTPIGRILLIGDDTSLLELHLPNCWSEDIEKEYSPNQLLFSETATQLDEYFSGKRKSFSLNLHPHGTDFQKKVWDELIQIPYGSTTSYGEIATRIGNPKASRAVGLANNRNPIPIIIPCHRVIGKNGSLTGYGGGTALKKQLLDLEQKYL